MFDRACTGRLQPRAQGAWSWDLGTNRVHADRAYCEILGIPYRATLRPFHIVPLILPADREGVLCSLFLTMGGQSIRSITYRIRRPDGDIRTIIGRAKLDLDEQGFERTVRGSITDVTGHVDLAGENGIAEPAAQQQRAYVVVVGRERFSRMGLVSLVAASPQLEVLGDTDIDAAAVQALWSRVAHDRHATPLALIIDVNELHPCFEDLVRTVLTEDPRIHVLALIRYEALDAVAPLMRAGAERLLTSETAEHTLLQTIHDMCFRTAPSMESQPADLGLTVYGESFPGAQGPAQLTAAEARVLRLLARGLRNREIAEALYVSEPTVKRHTQRIYRKLGARDRAHAAAIAQHIGLVR